MSEAIPSTKEMALDSVITTAVQIPGVKVNRKKFLSEIFAGEDVAIQDILDFGPVQANISQENLLVAKLLIKISFCFIIIISNSIFKLNSGKLLNSSFLILKRWGI